MTDFSFTVGGIANEIVGFYRREIRERAQRRRI
jgi:hypothetical protein